MPKRILDECDNPGHDREPGIEYAISSVRGGTRVVILCSACRETAPFGDVLRWSQPKAGRRDPAARAVGTDISRLRAIRVDD